MIAAVDRRGQIFDLVKEPLDASVGPSSLFDQIVRLARPLIKKYNLKLGGIASAGPLDPIKGVWLNPTNMKTSGKSWGVVSVVKPLEKKLKIKLKLENDAAAGVLAEGWLGKSKGEKNLILVTLGTGLGVGVIANGGLVRSGRFLHPEAGHMIIDVNDNEHLCGCGNYGCAEALLSGSNFTHSVMKKIGITSLTGEEMVRMADAGDQMILNEFETYSRHLSAFLFSLSVLFSPKTIVIGGGFAHAHPHFINRTALSLEKMMRNQREGHDLLPRLFISKFADEACLLGAAQLGFQRE